jgi:flagellar hook-length control protein FliK
VLISQIVAVDPPSKHFADSTATSFITPAGESFQDYMTLVMRPEAAADVDPYAISNASYEPDASYRRPVSEESSGVAPERSDWGREPGATRASERAERRESPESSARATGSDTGKASDAARGTDTAAEARKQKPDDESRKEEKRVEESEASASGRVAKTRSREKGAGAKDDVEIAAVLAKKGVEEALAASTQAEALKSAATDGGSSTRAAVQATPPVIAEITIDGETGKAASQKATHGATASGSAIKPSDIKQGASGEAARERGGPERTADESDESRVRPARVAVRDLRRQEAGQERGGEQNGKSAGEQATTPRTSDSAEPASHGSKTAEAFEFRAADGSAPVRSTAAPATRSEVLANVRQSLQEGVNSEIVRNARMIVRGNDTGEIRLTLKPEALGSVRILLEMHEGHIAGRIIVDNASVRDVFEQNMASLIRAFQESGLEAGALDVTVADSGDRGAATPESRQTRAALQELEQSVPVMSAVDDDHQLVDLVV